MKKVLVLASLVLGSIVAHAQSEFKPTKGDITTEFGLSGGVLNSNFNLNEAGNLLRFRYFAEEKTAIRLGFGLTSDNGTANAYGANNAQGEVKNNNTELLINLGVEKHFTGTERLSTYAGGDLLFGYASQKISRSNATGIITNPVYAANTASSVEGPNTVSFGLRGVVGADYYFAKKVYLGAEAGFGFLYSKAGETTVSNTVGGNTTTVTNESAGNAFQLNPSVITGLRIGFVF